MCTVVFARIIRFNRTMASFHRTILVATGCSKMVCLLKINNCRSICLLCIRAARWLDTATLHSLVTTLEAILQMWKLMICIIYPSFGYDYWVLASTSTFGMHTQTNIIRWYVPNIRCIKEMPAICVLLERFVYYFAIARLSHIDSKSFEISFAVILTALMNLLTPIDTTNLHNHNDKLSPHTQTHKLNIDINFIPICNSNN